MQIIIDIPDGDYKFIKDLQFYNSGRRCGRTIEQNVILGIRNGIPYEPKGDLISRDYVEKIISSEFVDLQDGTEEWRTYVNDTCENILNKVHNAPSVNLCDNCDLYFKAMTKEEMKKGGADND